MSSSKSKLKSVVSSSFIRRSSFDGLKDNNVNEYKNLAPYDEPDIVSSKDKINLDYLSNTEIKVFNKIKLKIKKNENNTDRIYIENLSEELQHPISTLKKTIQKLEKKGIIIREYFKAGRGGWSVYSINENLRDK